MKLWFIFSFLGRQTSHVYQSYKDLIVISSEGLQSFTDVSFVI